MSIKINFVILVFAAVFCISNAVPVPEYAVQYAMDATNPKLPLLKPQYRLDAGIIGNNMNNWAGQGTVGLGMKAWESQNGRHAFGVGASYGRIFGRMQGNSFMSGPILGFGLGYRYKFRR